MGRKKTVFQWERDGTEEEPVERTSRGQSKREESARKELIKRLLDLNAGERAALPMSEELQDALDEALRLRAKRRGKSGYRRQLLQIASLLRFEEVDAIEAGLAPIRKGTS